MTDQPAAQGQQLPPEIEQIIKAMVAEQVDQRAKGFQRLDAAKQGTIDDLRSQLRELKIASLDPEEAEQFRQTELQSENERLQALLDVQSLMGQYPEEAPYFQRLISASDTEGQLVVMREFAQSLKPQAPAPAGTTPPAPGTVDPNRPATPQAGPSVTLADGTQMSEAQADMILGGTTGKLAEYTQQRR